MVGLELLLGYCKDLGRVKAVNFKWFGICSSMIYINRKYFNCVRIINRSSS